jgi:hypothetical protein
MDALQQKLIDEASKPGLSLQNLSFSYGENTSLSISILQCHIQVCAMPQQGKYLVETELHVTNDRYPTRVEGKLRFPLTSNATVVRYALEIEGKMVDALALPKRKAAEVHPYQELYYIVLY